MHELKCKCGGKLHKHEIKGWKMNKKSPIYKQRYKCTECGKTITTPLDGIMDKFCNISITQKIIKNTEFTSHIFHNTYKNFFNIILNNKNQSNINI